MSGIVDYLDDVFRLLGTIRVRRMFGGHGVYCDDLMFALVDDDTLYLKADAETAPHFRELGLAPFEFVKDGKVSQMSYFAAPAEVLDDADQARIWGQMACEAALRAQARASRRKR